MSVTVSKIKYDHDRSWSNRNLHVYIDDTKLHKIADKWFNDNELYSLQVKSKAWNKIVRYLNSVLEPKIAKHFGVAPAECKYSRKVGCSCGCSPGFRIKNAEHKHQRCDACIKVNISDSEIDGLNQLIESYKFQRLFAKDLEADKLEKVRHASLPPKIDFTKAFATA